MVGSSSATDKPPGDASILPAVQVSEAEYNGMASSRKIAKIPLLDGEKIFSLVKLSAIPEAKAVINKIAADMKEKGIDDVLFTSCFRYVVVKGGGKFALKKLSKGALALTPKPNTKIDFCGVRLKWPTRFYYAAYKSDKLGGLDFAKFKPRFEVEGDPSSITKKSSSDKRGKHSGHKRGIENGNSKKNRAKRMAPAPKLVPTEVCEDKEGSDKYLVETKDIIYHIHNFPPKRKSDGRIALINYFKKQGNKQWFSLRKILIDVIEYTETELDEFKDEVRAVGLRLEMNIERFLPKKWNNIYYSSAGDVVTYTGKFKLVKRSATYTGSTVAGGNYLKISTIYGLIYDKSWLFQKPVNGSFFDIFGIAGEQNKGARSFDVSNFDRDNVSSTKFKFCNDRREMSKEQKRSLKSKTQMEYNKRKIKASNAKIKEIISEGIGSNQIVCYDKCGVPIAIISKNMQKFWAKNFNDENWQKNMNSPPHNRPFYYNTSFAYNLWKPSNGQWPMNQILKIFDFDRHRNRIPEEFQNIQFKDFMAKCKVDHSPNEGDIIGLNAVFGQHYRYTCNAVNVSSCKPNKTGFHGVSPTTSGFIMQYIIGGKKFTANHKNKLMLAKIWCTLNNIVHNSKKTKMIYGAEKYAEVMKTDLDDYSIKVVSNFSDTYQK